ncbi:MAG: hypothetical protein ACREIT_05010 [Tepidisphaeraceae bacterium]
MTSEDMKQELDREPFTPLRLHLSSGQTLDVRHAHTAWVRQNTLLLVHPIKPGTHEIGNYNVIALRLIERVEQLNGHGNAKRSTGRRR